MIEQLLKPVKHYADGLQTVAELDGVLLQLNMLVLSLRVRRNRGILLASQMPAEILSEIFYFATAGDLDQSLTSENEVELSYPRTLFNLRRVCARWRTVTSNSPRLWTNISVHYSPRIMQMMISASSLLPLTVRQSPKLNGLNASRMAPRDKLLQSVFFRLQNLEVHLTTKEGRNSLLASIFDLDLPELRSLKYASSKWVRGQQHITYLVSIVQRFPHLSVLQLSGISILSVTDGASASGPYGLTVLNLHNADICETHLQALVCIAQCFPQLLALELGVSNLNDDPVKIIDNSLPISFPCLGNIELSNLPSTTCMNILGRLMLPAHCRIRISVDLSYLDPLITAGAVNTASNEINQHILHIVRSLLEFYEAHLRRDIARHRVCVAVFHHDHTSQDQQFTLDDAPSDCIFPLWDRRPRPLWTIDLPLIEIAVNHGVDPVYWSDIPWPTIPAFHSVQTLRLLSHWEGEAVNETRTSWNFLRQLFPNIRSIGVDYSLMEYDTVAQEYLGALQMGRSPCFSKLQYLAIYQRSLDSIRKDASEMLEFICSCLAGRQNTTCPWLGVEIVWYECAKNGGPSDEVVDGIRMRLAQYKLDQVSIRYVDYD